MFLDGFGENLDVFIADFSNRFLAKISIRAVFTAFKFFTEIQVEVIKNITKI
jgi:hypothetical protein